MSRHSSVEAVDSTGQRLEKSTDSSVGTVVDTDDKSVLLLQTKQIEILNALNMPIALLDTRGRIDSVNEAWRRFAQTNTLNIPDDGVGLNYLAICDGATGDVPPKHSRSP